MGWKGVTVMDQRVRFISEYLDGYFPVNELCDQFSISRKTAYKWIHRFEKEGPKGLEDRSHRPHSCPHKTDSAIVEAILKARMKHPTWGRLGVKATLYTLLIRRNVIGCGYGAAVADRI
jgi:putative transposase